MPLRMRAEAGAVAIYTVPTATSTDNAPLTDPRNNFARLEFHTGLHYPQVVAVQQVSFTLPSISGGVDYNNTHIVSAHGLPYTPWVFATATIGGVSVPLVGSVAVQMSGGVSAAVPGIPRLITIGATSSYIVMHDYGYTSPLNGGAYSLAALSMVLDIYITSEAL